MAHLHRQADAREGSVTGTAAESAVAQHVDHMTVSGAEEAAKAPGLVGEGMHDLGALSHGSGIRGVHVVVLK
jgi:hypothetical protein